MHKESRYREMEFSEEKIARLLYSENCFCSLAKSGDTYIGFIWGLVQEAWFSDCKTGFDLGLYILPEYRGKGMAPIRLIKSFEEFCRSKNCYEISLSSSVKVNDLTVSRLYEKLGYHECGFITYKNIV